MVRCSQVVVITGATSAVGRSLAHDLFRSDCRLILCARNEYELELLKAELISAARNEIQNNLRLRNVTYLMGLLQQLMRAS